MMRQILLYIFILFVSSIGAEQFRITGKVICNSEIGEINEFKEPLIGAGVQVVGTSRYTYTDIDGNFSIEVEKGAILKFSFAGFHSKEVEILNDSSLVIELEDDGVPLPEVAVSHGPSCRCPSCHLRKVLITGKVVDAENNEPLIGAIVEIKGTDRRTATDIDGNFSIEVEKGEILKFSNVGSYSKEEEILSDSSLVIELEDKSLEDMTPTEIELLRIVCIQGWRPSPWRPIGPFSPVQPVEPDSLKTNPAKNQNNVINH